MGSDRRPRHDGRGARRRRSGADARHRGRAARRDPGVVRVTDEAFELAATEPIDPALADGAPTDDERPPIELTESALEALLFVAERPLSRREIAALAGTDRATVDERLGRPRGLAARPRRAAPDRRRPCRAGDGRRGAARSSRATWARMPSVCPRRRSRRWPSWRTGNPSRRPPSSGSAASIRTTRSGRCCIAGCSWSSAGPRRPAGRSCTAPASSSSSGSGSRASTSCRRSMSTSRRASRRRAASR